MKKAVMFIFISMFFLFVGCDLFVDEIAIHNGLVDKMDAVMLAEENFYNEYWLLADEGDSTNFLAAYDNFEIAVKELDEYYENTKFSSNQQVFVNEYYEYYKPFIDEYVAYAKDFKDIVKNEGYTFDRMEEYFVELDQYTYDFIDIHNSLIGTINTQADVTAADQMHE